MVRLIGFYEDDSFISMNICFSIDLYGLRGNEWNKTPESFLTRHGSARQEFRDNVGSSIFLLTVIYTEYQYKVLMAFLAA